MSSQYAESPIGDCFEESNLHTPIAADGRLKIAAQGRTAVKSLGQRGNNLSIGCLAE